MNPLLGKKALEKINQVARAMPREDVLMFFNHLMEAYKENQNTVREMAHIEARKEIIIDQMQKRYDVFYYVFDNVFKERHETIQKMFTIIDRGIQENDRELISSGMQNLSKVVSSSPFACIDKLSNMLEDGQNIEI